MDASSGGHAWAGGLVGQNTGSVRASYCVGSIFANGDASGYSYACGFAGSNGGSVSDSYAAMELRANGDGADIHSFSADKDKGVPTASSWVRGTSPTGEARSLLLTTPKRAEARLSPMSS